MTTLHHSIQIDAPAEKVWHAMLDDATYREWTEAFNPGSYFEGNWEQGSNMRFLGPDPETGKLGGMLSRIAENRPNEFVSIEHIGIIENGIEDTASDRAKEWTPAYENYTLVEKDGKTEVQIDVDVDEKYAEEMGQMWEDGLKRLKEVAERN